MSTHTITPEVVTNLSSELEAKLAHVRTLLAAELSPLAENDACLTCSFQAEDVLLLDLKRSRR